MKHCIFCHQQLEDDAVFCINCGKKQVKEEELSLQKNQNIQQHTSYNRQYASWCRIGREQKSLYEESAVSEKIFMEYVDHQLKRNQVAASIQYQNVVIDGREKKEYVIDFNHSRGDHPVSMILRYMKEGIYTYIQCGMYVTPPSLPEKPSKEPKYSFCSDGFFGLCVGLIILIMGVGMETAVNTLVKLTGESGSGSGGPILFILIGLGMIGWGGYLFYQFIRWFKEYKEWSRQNELWMNAWNTWKQNEYEYAVHALGLQDMMFTYEAVIQTIQDVCHKVFEKGPVSEAFSEVSDYELAKAAENLKFIDK